MKKSVFFLLSTILALCLNNATAQVFDDGGATSPNNMEERTAGGKKIIRSRLLTNEETNTQQGKLPPRVLLYFKNFKIDLTPSGRVICSFDLTMRNATPNKINTFNAQFIWPSIKTTGSFYDVPAKSERYLSLALMGKGCYSMDKAPNIIVNHCRIKGMSAEECSEAVRWIKIK